MPGRGTARSALPSRASDVCGFVQRTVMRGSAGVTGDGDWPGSGYSLVEVLHHAANIANNF